MQIHELTSKKKLKESFMGDLAKSATGAVKGAVGNVVQSVKDKAGQIGAQLKDPKAWTSTSASASAKGGAQLAQQTAKYAQQLAKEWPAVAKTITSKDAPAAKQTPTLRQAPQKTTTATNKPTPNIQGGSELQKAQAAGSPARLAVGDNRSELQIAAEPNSIANRQLAKEPNKLAVPAEEPISIGGQKLNPKNPKDAKLIAQLKAKGNLEEAFGDIPGAKPAVGGTVDSKVTAQPNTIKQGNPLQSSYITKFKQWADSKTTTKETNTGTTIDMNTVTKEIPGFNRQLNTALTAVYNTRQDPTANEQAVVGYLTQAIKGVQQVAAKIRAENPQATASVSSSGGFADPRVGEQLAKQLKLDLAAFKQSLGKEVVRPTGNPQLDGLLKAAGVI